MKQILLFLGILLPIAIGTAVFGQTPMAVQRCADIDRNAPIQNIFIDGNNNKWVADQQGLFLAQSPDHAQIIDDKPGQWSLLSASGGNQEVYFAKATLEEQLGTSTTNISAAIADKRKKELWIGTRSDGLFQFSTDGSLRLLKKWTSDNTKLRSNNIQALFLTPTGKLLAATDDGLFSYHNNKTELYAKGYNFKAIAYNNNTVWVIADDEVLEMDKKGGLYEVDLEERMFDGAPVDIDFDFEGRLWIASEVVVRYDFETEKYDYFGPAEDFTSQGVRCIAVDADNALWVGTQNKGVYYIGKASSLNASIAVTTALDCTPDAQNAALQVRASGGQPPYAYQWNTSVSGAHPKGLGPGEYIVTVTDQNGKSTTTKKIIKDSKLVVTVRELKPAAEGGGTDGQAMVEVSGGSGRYTYQWDNGETTATAKKLTAGDHVVTVSEKDGCSTKSNITITEKFAALTVALEETDPVKCHDGKGGALKANASGGKGPYQYQWSEGNASGASARNLVAGTYEVTVTDVMSSTAVAKISIAAPKPVTATITVNASATANNADGKATAKAQGGSGKKYTYRWDTGETQITATKLAAGTHAVTVTDQNGCTTVANIDITENILPLSVKLDNPTPIKCAGESTAVVRADVSGGKSPFTYEWNNNSGTGESASNLGEGNCEVTVTDAAGNTAVAKINIAAPKKVTATITVNASATANNADGRATAKAQGGSGKKYTYRWDTGETQNTATKLAAGTHAVTVTDQNSCTTVANIDITENILPLSVKLDNPTAIKCAGESTAVVRADVSGGKSPFTYEWNNNSGTGKSASNLSEGNCEVTVTDAAGNTAVAKINIAAPKEVTTTITVNASATANNADGRATAKAQGGSGKKYSYRWSTGETQNTATKLAAGTHSVTVTDQNGCTASANIDITENILPLSVKLGQPHGY